MKRLLLLTACAAAAACSADWRDTSLPPQKRAELLTAEMTLDDHHVYKVRDMHALEALLSEHPGAVIVTTEKDAVKMTRREKVPEAVRRTLYYQPINISFIEDSATDFLQKLEEDVRGN